MSKKVKKTLLIISILVVILAIIIMCYINIINRTLADSDKQAEVLNEIYEYFLKDYNSNITLDESALRNFKTNESFNEENIQKLKQHEKTVSDSYKNYTLYVSSDPYISYINLRLKNNDSNESYQQHFYLKPGLFKISFEPNQAIVLGN